MYSSTILRVAAITSLKHIGLLVGLIGTPIIFFNGKLATFEKVGLLFGLFIFFWLLYLGLCFLFHRLSLRKSSNLNHYLSLDEVAKGKAVGSYLDGW